MRKTFKLFCAAALSLLAVSSCYDDSSLWNEFDNVHGEIKDLKARVEKLEKDLKADVENLTALQGKVNTMETTLTQAIADGDAADELAGLSFVQYRTGARLFGNARYARKRRTAERTRTRPPSRARSYAQIRVKGKYSLTSMKSF